MEWRETIVQELAGQHHKWQDAVNARDIDAYAELVAEDVVWIPPSGDAIEGREAFRKWLAPFFTAYAYAYSTSEPRFRAAGNRVVESCEFESLMTPASGGSPMSHSGSYVVIWRRDPDSAWRIERYIDRSLIRDA